MRTRYYILTGIIAYLVFLIFTIPATLVIGPLKESLPVKVGSIDGTLWNGYASTLQTNSGMRFDNIRWSFLPSRLLFGRAALDVTATFLDNQISSEISTSITGRLSVKNLNLDLPADEIAYMISLPLGELSGDFNIMINSISWAQGSVPEINGKINWNRAALTVAETVDLGKVSILLTEKDESPVTLVISNRDGDLSIDGNMTTTASGDYELLLTMKPLPGASTNIVNSIAMFAQRQSNGSFKFSNKGNLQQLGLF